MEIVIIIALILLNGLFSMSEMAMVSSRKFKLESAKRQGKSGAKKAMDLAENPTKFLSTIQIGITLIGILLGVYSGDNITKYVANFFSQFSLLKPIASQLGTGLVVITITYFSIVLGELLPKRIGMLYPEPVAIAMSKFMSFLSLLVSPFVWLLTASNNFLARLLRLKSSAENMVTEEEIKSIIRESAEGGEIQDIEQDIVERVFELGDRKVNSLLTYRSDITYFDMEDDWETVKEKINSNKHSAYPIVENNSIDNIIGIVTLKDLFDPILSGKLNLKSIMKEPLYLNEKTSAYQVLEQFKLEKIHYGIVVDEYGATQGVVSMDDVLDALIGEATEIDQDEYQLLQRDDNSWLVDGQYSIFDFSKYFDVEVSEEIQAEYTTVAGLMIHCKGDLLNEGDVIDFENLRLEVVDKDGQRIDKILVSRNEEA
ncbi:MAG: hemolysin family protein [Crocinitomicaceae bacterium]|nr:hemolysin family protein [Crocinitomicaceae bacterium]